MSSGVSTVVASNEAADADGRRRRSQDSRGRIVAAMLALIQEGEVAPGAEQVAARARVGLRSVFRHFNDMDSLYGEMLHTIEGELLSVAERPFKGESWQDRVVELVERRSDAYEKIAPYKRAADLQRHRSPVLEAGHARLVAQSRDILRRQLPAEIVADEFTFEALDLALSYEAWSRLRREQASSPQRARGMLESLVRAILKI